MAVAVLDASALLALLNQEAGAERVANAIVGGAAMSAVNLSEVAAKLMDSGMQEELAREILDRLPIEVVAFDTEAAYTAGALRPLTRAAGLSLGDRACIALAGRLHLPALTTDRIWERLAAGIRVELIR